MRIPPLIVALILRLPAPRLAMAQEPPLAPPVPQELEGRRNNILLRVTDAGIPSINDQAIPWSRFKAELKAIFEQRPAKILILETGARNKYEDLRRAVEAAREQGITVFAALKR